MPETDSQELRYRQGIRLFNSRAFFDAHEVLEDLWRGAAVPEKPFLQGLIQVAVALHHYSKGNATGAASLLARGERNLAGYPEMYGGIDLGALRRAITAWRRAIGGGHAPPPPPQLRTHGPR